MVSTGRTHVDVVNAKTVVHTSGLPPAEHCRTAETELGRALISTHQTIISECKTNMNWDTDHGKFHFSFCFLPPFSLPQPFSVNSITTSHEHSYIRVPVGDTSLSPHQLKSQIINLLNSVHTINWRCFYPHWLRAGIGLLTWIIFITHL